jgi:hypothetical protein
MKKGDKVYYSPDYGVTGALAVIAMCFYEDEEVLLEIEPLHGKGKILKRVPEKYVHDLDILSDW